MAEQLQWIQKGLDIYGPTLGQGQASYPGTRVAPMTPTQTTAADVKGFLDQFAPYRDMPMYGEGIQALSGILSGTTGAAPITPEMAKTTFGKIFERPAMKRWSEDIRPSIQEAYAGPGYWSSARAKAEMEGSQDVADWLGTKEGQFMWDVEQANRQIEEAKAGRALAGLQPALQYGYAPTQEAQQKLAGRAGAYELSSVEQRQRQNEINAAIQRFAEENRLTEPEDLEILLRLIGLQGADRTIDEYDVPGWMDWVGMGAKGLASIYGGGGMAGALGAMGS
jgi:hypothetical protein